MNVDGNNAGHEVCLFVVCIACFCALSFLMSFQVHHQSYYSSDKSGATDTIDTLCIRDWTYPAILPALGQVIWEDITTLWNREAEAQREAKMEVQTTYKTVDYKLTYNLVEWGLSYLYFSEFEMHCQDFDFIKHCCLSFKALQCCKAYPMWVTPKESNTRNFPVMNVNMWKCYC